MGRATLHLLHGNIRRSFAYNILCIPFTLSIAIALLWMCRDIIKNSNSFALVLHKLDTGLAKWCLALLILLDWSVNIYRHI